MRVRITESMVGERFVHNVGEEIEVPDHIGQEWIRLNRAEPLPPLVEAAVARPAERAVAHERHGKARPLSGYSAKAGATSGRR